MEPFEVWFDLCASLNPQWRNISLRDKFIRTPSKEICSLYYELLLNFRNRKSIEKEIYDRYGFVLNSDNGNTRMAIYPFRIYKNSAIGRHLVSNREIHAGEVLLIESRLVKGPIVHYPYDKEVPSCVHCLSEAVTYLCPKCGFYLCRNEQCKNYHISQLECIYLNKLNLVDGQKHIHNLEEKDFKTILSNRPKGEWIGCCKTVADAYIKFISDQRTCVLKYYPAIPTLNVLCLLEKCRPLEKIISSLQGNVIPGSRRYKVNQKHIVNVIKQMKLPYSEEFIHKVAAIWDTNAFQSEESKRNVQVLFALSSLFTHSCKPNCENSFIKGSQTMIFRAAENIAEGTVLTINYTDPFWPTYIRRENLEVSKNFICECARCLDPTEYGTYSGHSLCESCKTYSICSTFSNGHCKSLTCNTCYYQTDTAKFFTLEAATCNLLSHFKVSDLKTYEEIVCKLNQTFKNRYHEHHYIYQRIRLSLFLEHSIQNLSELDVNHLQKLFDLLFKLYIFCSAILPSLSLRKAQVSREFLRYIQELKHQNVQIPLSKKEIEDIQEVSNLVLSW